LEKWKESMAKTFLGDSGQGGASYFRCKSNRVKLSKVLWKRNCASCKGWLGFV
jgi:hypothetical protein